MTIPEFIKRCDAYCQATGRSRVWLSKALLADTFRLDLLAKGSVDIGVKRLAKAAEDLAELERLAAEHEGGGRDAAA